MGDPAGPVTARPATHARFGETRTAEAPGTPDRTVGKGGVKDPKPLAPVPLKQSKDPILKQSLALLGKYRGIVYGELHFRPTTRDWVRSNLPDLKAAGVKVLFLEVMNWHQPLISDFLNGKLGDDEKSNEDNFRKGMTKELHSKYPDVVLSISDLIVEAKKQSIDVVAMDVADPAPEKEETLSHRLEYANSAWAKAVTEQMSQQPNGAKYAMIAGVAHTNKVSGTTDQGVNVLLGTASIDIVPNSAAIIVAGKKNSAILWPETVPASSILSNEIMIVPGGLGADFFGIIPDAPQKTSH